MSEVLEGVLSEEILDALAEDLGIDATVLRQHPFFRVFKGRVLLTYPLRSSLYTGDVVDGVWDEDVSASHVTVGTAGSRLEASYDRITAVMADYARRTAYTYGPTNLAAGATFVPAAGTVITIAILENVAINDFEIVHGTSKVYQKPDGYMGYFGFIYCDGTNVGIKNGDGVGRDLSIEGFTP